MMARGMPTEPWIRMVERLRIPDCLIDATPIVTGTAATGPVVIVIVRPQAPGAYGSLRQVGVREPLAFALRRHHLFAASALPRQNPEVTGPGATIKQQDGRYSAQVWAPPAGCSWDPPERTTMHKKN